MRSITPTRLSAAAMLLLLPVGVTGCSFGSSSDKPSPSRSAGPSAEPSDGTTSSNGAGTGGKPSKEQVRDGMQNYFVGKGVPRQLMGTVSECVVDEGYDDLSDATLRALQTGQLNKLNPVDTAKLTQVTTTCLARGGGAAASSAG